MNKLNLLSKIFIISLLLLIITYVLKTYTKETFSPISHLTIFFPYYNNPEQLKKNIYHYDDLSSELKHKLEIFIVDDGSNKFPALDILNKIDYNLNVTLYRINIDVPWNMSETNNLAFKLAKHDFLLRTDIDHYIDEENLIKIFNKKNLSSKNMYFFSRKSVNSSNKKKKLNNHINSYLISKNMFYKINGYNESFSNNYGFEDIEFIYRLSNFPIGLGFKKKLYNIYLERRNEGGTKNLNRNTSINKLLLEKCKSIGCEHIKYKNKKYYIKQLQTKCTVYI